MPRVKLFDAGLFQGHVTGSHTLAQYHISFTWILLLLEVFGAQVSMQSTFLSEDTLQSWKNVSPPGGFTVLR